MDTKHPHFHTRLFRLRLWLERVGADTYEWRGQLTNIETRESRSFRTPAQLVTSLGLLLHSEPGEPSLPGPWLTPESGEEV